MTVAMLFVHGTGVRANNYVSTLRLIERQVQRRHLAATVTGTFWGEAEGARLINGESIPGYTSTGGDPTEADETLALWAVLYTDPWYELRLLRHRPAGGPAAFGQTPPSLALRHLLDQFQPSPELLEAFAVVELESFFRDALAAILSSAELRDAIRTAAPDMIEHRRAVARAIIADTLVRGYEDGHPVLDGAYRDELVLSLTNALAAEGLGIGEFLSRPVKGMAQRLVTRKLVGDRGSISDAAAPAAGDILRFLSRGDGVRRFVRKAIEDLGSGPVYLLAHSLGGVICADLLVREKIPNVCGIITVGSQSPFLYEIGAFPSLAHPETLPDHFPSWLNVYDKRDVLSYTGAGVFGGCVTDVELDNRQPFPQSHSAYWTNPALWKAISEFVG